jgi:hypothetical protein
MKWVVLALFVLAILVLGFGAYTEWSGRSPDEKAGSSILYIIGIALLAVDAAIILIYGALTLFR